MLRYCYSPFKVVVVIVETVVVIGDLVLKAYTKPEAIRIVTEAAKDYAENLVNRNFIIIYKDRKNNRIDFFETVFLPRNFQHLSGIEYVDEDGNILERSVQFFNKCCNHSLSEKEIQYKNDGTTHMKLQALPKVVKFFKFSKMTTTLDVYKPFLEVDRLVGNISCCLGFLKEGNYYIPNSCLLEDIRVLGKSPSQILAVLSKPATSKYKTYSEIKYTAKGVTVENLTMSKKLSSLIEL